MINTNEIVKNILKQRKNKLKSRVINKEENKIRLETYKKSKSIKSHFFSSSIDKPLQVNKRVKKVKQIYINEEDIDFECQKYYEMMKLYGYMDQGEMNNYISKNDLWSNFPSIRAKNTHGSIENIKGITPKAYARVCELMGRTISTNGRPLVDSKRY